MPPSNVQKIIGIRGAFALTQAAAAIAVGVAHTVTNKETKAALTAAGPIAALAGYLGGDAAVDSYDNLVQERAQHFPGGADISEKTRISRKSTFWKHELPYAVMSSGASLGAYFTEAPNKRIAGATVGFALIGGLAGVAVLLCDRFFNESGLTRPPGINVRPSRCVQMGMAAGCLVGGIVGAACVGQYWLTAAFNPSTSFMGAAIPPLAQLIEGVNIYYR